MQPTSELNDSDLWWLNVMGRLKPGTRDVEESAALDVALAAAVRNTMTVGSDETLPHLILINGSSGNASDEPGSRSRSQCFSFSWQ